MQTSTHKTSLPQGRTDGDALLRGAIFGLLVGHEHGVGEHQPRAAVLFATAGHLRLEGTVGHGSDRATWAAEFPWHGATALKGAWPIDLTQLREALRVENNLEGRTVREVGEVTLTCDMTGHLLLTAGADPIRLSAGSATEAPVTARGRADGWQVPASTVASLAVHSETAAPMAGVLLRRASDGSLLAGAVGLGGVSVHRISDVAEAPLAGDVTVGARALQVTAHAARTSQEAWDRLGQQAIAGGEPQAKAALLTLWLRADPEACRQAIHDALMERWVKLFPGLTDQVGLAREVALAKAILAEPSHSIRRYFEQNLPTLEASGVSGAVLFEAARDIGADGAALVGRLVGATRDGSKGSVMQAALLSEFTTPGGELDTGALISRLPRLGGVAERALRDANLDDAAWDGVGVAAHAGPTVRSMLLGFGLLTTAPDPDARITSDGHWAAKMTLPGGASLSVHAQQPMPAHEHPLFDSLESVLMDEAPSEGVWAVQALGSDLAHLFARAQAHRSFGAEWYRDPLQGFAIGPVVLLHPTGSGSTALPLRTPDVVWVGQDLEDTAFPVPSQQMASARAAGVTEGVIVHPVQGPVFRAVVRQVKPGRRHEAWAAVALDAVTAQELTQSLLAARGAVDIEVLPGVVRLRSSNGDVVALPTLGRRLLPPGAQVAAANVGIPEEAPAHAWTAGVRHLRAGVRRGALGATISPEARALSAGALAAATDEGIGKRLAAWETIPTTPTHAREMLRLGERFASGSALTLPFPSHLRAANRALSKVRKAADRLLDALSQPSDLFGEIEGDSVESLWAVFETTTALCGRVLGETPRTSVPEAARSPAARPELSLR